MSASNRIKKIANHLGFDHDSFSLAVAVQNKDHASAQNLLAQMDKKSVNRSFQWKRLFFGNLKIKSSLTMAIEKQDPVMVNMLLDNGAKFDQDSVSYAALYILCDPDSATTKALIAAYEDHHIDWSKGKFFKQARSDRAEYYGTSEMVLLVELKQKAFELGLFKNSKGPSLLVSVQDGHVQVAEVETGSIKTRAGIFRV